MLAYSPEACPPIRYSALAVAIFFLTPALPVDDEEEAQPPPVDRKLAAEVTKLEATVAQKSRDAVARRKQVWCKRPLLRR